MRTRNRTGDPGAAGPMTIDVGRMLRIRITAGLRREGINLPTALETAEPAGTD